MDDLVECSVAWSPRFKRAYRVLPRRIRRILSDFARSHKSTLARLLRASKHALDGTTFSGYSDCKCLNENRHDSNVADRTFIRIIDLTAPRPLPTRRIECRLNRNRSHRVNILSRPAARHAYTLASARPAFLQQCSGSERATCTKTRRPIIDMGRNDVLATSA